MHLALRNAIATRRQPASKHVQQRRLACTRRSDDGKHVPGLGKSRHALENLLLAHRVVDVAEFEHGLATIRRHAEDAVALGWLIAAAITGVAVVVVVVVDGNGVRVGVGGVADGEAVLDNAVDIDFDGSRVVADGQR